MLLKSPLKSQTQKKNVTHLKNRYLQQPRKQYPEVTVTVRDKRENQLFLYCLFENIWCKADFLCFCRAWRTGDGAEGDKAARLPKTSHLFFPSLFPPWDWQDFQLTFSNLPFLRQQ